MDLLPCPFCGSSDLALEDKGAFISCKTPGCGGKHFYNQDQWQRRAITDEQVKQAYAQFEASLKAEREKNAETNQSIIDMLKAAEFIKGFNWHAGVILKPTANDLNALKDLLKRYDGSPI